MFTGGLGTQALINTSLVKELISSFTIKLLSNFLSSLWYTKLNLSTDIYISLCFETNWVDFEKYLKCL